MSLSPMWKQNSVAIVAYELFFRTSTKVLINVHWQLESSLDLSGLPVSNARFGISFSTYIHNRGTKFHPILWKYHTFDTASDH